MRLKLDFEDVKFASTWNEQTGKYRWLVVTIAGKQFWVNRYMVEAGLRHKAAEDAIDELLVSKMEAMLQKVFEDAVKALPDGVIP
jgi:hypothetical protein